MNVNVCVWVRTHQTRSKNVEASKLPWQKVRRAKHPQAHQAVLPGAYEAELRAQPAWAQCDIDEWFASALALKS